MGYSWYFSFWGAVVDVALHLGKFLGKYDMVNTAKCTRHNYDEEPYFKQK
jgi:hypothetical protein